jgi:basic amino acid/polyamine antiporter, APA family
MSSSTEVDNVGGKSVGLVIATSLVTGTIIGAGIFSTPTSLARYGPISLLGYLLTTVGAILLALVFASLATRNPAAGGPYAYVRGAFGDFMGFQTGWNYWIGAWAGVAAIAVSMVGYVGQLIPGLSDNRLAQLCLAIGAIFLLTLINTKGVAAGGVVSTVLAVIKVVPLLLIGTLGFFFVDWSNFAPFNVSGLPPLEVIMTSATLTLFAFIGLEAATIPSANIRNPTRTIPLATLIGTGLAGLIYILSTTVVFGTVANEQLQTSEAPFAASADAMIGSSGSNVIALVAIVSTLGAMNGLILLAGQVPMAAAFDDLAPKVFGRVNLNGAPAAGLAISGVLAAALVFLNFSGGTLTDAFEQLILISTLTTLFPYVFSAGAQMLWVMTGRAELKPSQFWRQFVVVALALAYAILAVAGAGTESVYWGFLIILIGLPVYLWIVAPWAKSRQLDSGTAVHDDVHSSS